MKLFSKFAVLAALGAGSMFAGTITYNTSYGPVPTDVDDHGVIPGPVPVLVLPYWNPALFAGQTLTSVTLTIAFKDDVLSATISNTAPEAQVFKFLATSEADFSGAPDPISAILLNVFSTGTIALGGSGLPVCAVATPNIACSSVNYNPVAVTGTDTINSANPLAYVNTGNFTIFGQTSSGNSFIGGGNNETAALATNATFTASVTYNYAASQAPEPATMSLLGSALLGIGFFARKRAKKS